MGILLFGSRTNTVQNNRIYGNWLDGIGAIQAVPLDRVPGPQTLTGNSVTGNTLGPTGPT